MNIQLTISLLASDRIETLGKCLTSILPFLREINSELIIVTTGKDPAVTELAGKYTPHIIPFTWCNNFAEARNAGLRKARGEWFLFLDDDEWFEDTAEIIQFFKSGEYRKYNSATYIQRNYSDWSGRNYTDVSVGRMCRLIPETRFIYPIHENLTPFSEHYKQFHTYVHHYGYVEKSYLRSDRNLPLLMERMETAPTPLTCMQIALEYYNKEDYRNALDYCRRGLKLSENKEGSRHKLWLQVHLPILLASSGEKKEAIKEGEHLLFASRIPEVGEAHLRAFLAEEYTELKEYKNGLKHVLAFREAIKHLEEHPEKAERQTGGTITFATAKERAVTTFISGLFCAAALEETEKIQQLLAWLPWDNESEVRVYYNRLEEWKREYPECRKMILEAYSLLETGNFYVNLQKALYDEEQKRVDKVEDFWQKYIGYCPEAFLYQLVEMAERNMLSLNPLVESITADAWEQCAENLMEHTETKDMEECLQKLEQLMPDYPLFTAKVRQRFLEKKLSRGIVEREQFLEFLDEYCKCIQDEADVLYSAEILYKQDCYILPQKYRFAFIIEEVLENIKRGAYMDCLPLLKKTLHVCPPMAVVISRLGEYLGEMMEDTAQPVSAEFEILGKQVKQMLFQLIENGQWQEAYGITGQLISLLPGDLEILKLKQEIMLHI